MIHCRMRCSDNQPMNKLRKLASTNDGLFMRSMPVARTGYIG